jgi:CheY-like chemotaxis protein
MPQGGSIRLLARNVDLKPGDALLRPEVLPGPFIRIQVSDTGAGIPPEIMDKIFDPFFTTKPLGSGSGLGLFSVLGIVRSHGGFVDVRSTLGVGTEFMVYLPAALDGGAGRVASTVGNRARGTGEGVLVVDDEVFIREMIKRALEGAHYRVWLAADVSEGLALAEKHSDLIRVIVTDFMMPGMDGLQFIQKLRAAGCKLPIIAISGISGKYEEIRKAGISRISFLEKPFTSEQLLSLLGKALANPVA